MPVMGYLHGTDRPRCRDQAPRGSGRYLSRFRGA